MKYISNSLLIIFLFINLILLQKVYSQELNEGVWLAPLLSVSESGEISHVYNSPYSSPRFTLGSSGIDFGAISGIASNFLTSGFNALDIEEVKSVLNFENPGVPAVPIVTGDYYKYKKIVALGTVDHVGPDNTLERGNNKDGYRVIERRDWNLGLGVAITTPDTLGLFSIGISGIIERGATASRFIKNYDDHKKLKKPLIPRDLIQFTKTFPYVGDSLNYITKGGVMFRVGAGVPFFTVGAHYAAKGVWGVGIYRSGKTKLKVKISRGHIHQFGMTFQTTITSMGVEHFRNYDKNFHYEFDISDADTLKQYRNMVRGRIHKLQKALKENPKLKITKITEGKSKTTGTLVRKNTSVPFLFSNIRSRGKSYNLSNVRFLEKNLILEEHKGIYSDVESTLGLIAHDVQSISLFTGNFQKITRVKGTEKSTIDRYSANYLLSHGQNKVDPEEFQNILKKIKKMVGYRGQLDFKLPENYKGYAKIELNLAISNVAIDLLMKRAASVKDIPGFREKPRNYYAKLGEIAVNNYFKRVPTARKEFCKILIKTLCRSYMKRETKKALKKAFKVLNKMNHYYKVEPDSIKFIKLFSTFGKHMLKNRFTFQTLLWELRDTPLNATLTISGSKIAKYEKNLFSYSRKKIR